MNMTVFYNANNVFFDFDLVHGRAFDNAAIQDTCALLPVICADFCRGQEKCVHFSRFERRCPVPIGLAC